MRDAVVLANLVVTGYLAGLIWCIQIVHYPLFATVGDAAFPGYHRAHLTRISAIVAAPMVVELVLSALLIAFHPPLLPALGRLGLRVPHRRGMAHHVSALRLLARSPHARRSRPGGHRLARDHQLAAHGGLDPSPDPLGLWDSLHHARGMSSAVLALYPAGLWEVLRRPAGVSSIALLSFLRMDGLQ